MNLTSSFPVIFIKIYEKRFFDDVSLNYPNFNTLNNSDKMLFLFNIDPFICKKLGYFTFAAFQKKNNDRD